MSMVYSQCLICHQNIAVGHAMWCELYTGVPLVLGKDIFMDPAKLGAEVTVVVEKLIEKQQEKQGE